MRMCLCVCMHVSTCSTCVPVSLVFVYAHWYLSEGDVLDSCLRVHPCDCASVHTFVCKGLCIHVFLCLSISMHSYVFTMVTSGLVGLIIYARGFENI